MRLAGAQTGGGSASTEGPMPQHLAAWPMSAAALRAQAVSQQKTSRMADVPLAELGTFLRAWRIECPWLIVCKSVSMFTCCSVCEYLRLLIDQIPRDRES